MAKGNRKARLRSVVEGAVDSTAEARRAAAAEKIRAAAGTPADPPAPPPETPKRTGRKKPPAQEPEIEQDLKLEGSSEQRVPESPKKFNARKQLTVKDVARPAVVTSKFGRTPPVAPDPPEIEFSPPQMTADQAQRLRDTMLQSNRPTASPPAADRPKPPQGTFAPIRGPGAALGKMLKATYRQGPNILANAVAIPAFTAAGGGLAYLGTAGTVAAIRGIGKLLSPGEAKEEKPATSEPLTLPAPPPASDYKSEFQRAIDERRNRQPRDSGTDIFRKLQRMRGNA